MIGQDDARFTYEYFDHFKILPDYLMKSKLKKKLLAKVKKYTKILFIRRKQIMNG